MNKFPIIINKLSIAGADPWIVGSSACQDGLNHRDLDIVIPYQGWKIASQFIPKDSTPNIFGGWFFMCGESKIDIWPDDIGRLMSSEQSGEYIINYRTGVVLRKSKLNHDL